MGEKVEKVDNTETVEKLISEVARLTKIVTEVAAERDHMRDRLREGIQLIKFGADDYIHSWIRTVERELNVEVDQ